jgi:hypothetical protein
MAQKQIDTNQLTDIELKAHVYDMSAQVQMINQSIDGINQIIMKRAQARLDATQAVVKTHEESDAIAEPTV